MFSTHSLPFPATEFAVCALSAAVIWKVAGHILRLYLLRKLTVVDDLPELGSPRIEKKRLKGAAVICGGSVAGLWAARVCSDHFEKVIIVEAEKWLETDEGVEPVCDENGNMYSREGKHERTRVMQAEAIHVYQNINIVALRKVFPELDAEMAKRDIRTQKAPFLLYLPSGKVIPPSFNQGLDQPVGTAFSASRETYEKLLRYYVRQIPNIEWTSGMVTDLQCAEGDLSIAEGVKVRLCDGEQGDKGEQFIPASLVIDCSGRAQAGLKWLKRIHTSIKESSPNVNPVPPPCLRYDIQGRYQMFHFNIAPKLRPRLDEIIPGGYYDAGWILLYVPEPGRDDKLIVITKTEGHRIKVLLISYGDVDLPTKSEDLESCLRSLACKEPLPEWVFQLAATLAEDETYVGMTKKMPPCMWVQYENATHIPSNLIALGDATMCANPMWGQGCSKAIIASIILDKLLRTNQCNGDSATLPRDFSKTFFRMHKEKIGSVWEGTKPLDYGYATTVPSPGDKKQGSKLERGFSFTVLRLAMKHAWISDRLWKVRLFLAPPTDLLHPLVLVLAGWELTKEFIGLA